jgi:hypothetical protein
MTGFRYGASAAVVFLSLALAASESPASVVVYANDYPGTTAGQRIRAALEALPDSGGVVDAREITLVPLTIDVPIYVGAKTDGNHQLVNPPIRKPASLLLGPGVYTTTQFVTVYDQSSVVGMPGGSSNGQSDFRNNYRTVITAANDALLWAIVRVGDDDRMGGYGAVIQDITIDGNKDASGTVASPESAGLLIIGSDRVDVTRVSVQRCNGTGMLVRPPTSRPGPYNGPSGTVKFTKIISAFNGENGLFVRGQSNDITVDQSEFEHNIGHGIEVDNCGALRITNSDVSSNYSGANRYGLYIHGTSNAGFHIVSANQFSNKGADIFVVGPGANNNTIASNLFIGNGLRPAGQVTPVFVYGSNGNNITGNIVRTAGSMLARAIVVVGDGNVVATNVISVLGAGGFVNPPISLTGDNMDYGNFEK